MDPDLAMVLAQNPENPGNEACCSGVGIVNDNTLTCYNSGPARQELVIIPQSDIRYGDGHGQQIFNDAIAELDCNSG